MHHTVTLITNKHDIRVELAVHLLECVDAELDDFLVVAVEAHVVVVAHLDQVVQAVSRSRGGLAGHLGSKFRAYAIRFLGGRLR